MLGINISEKQTYSSLKVWKLRDLHRLILFREIHKFKSRVKYLYFI
jgi:hypothetical protein